MVSAARCISDAALLIVEAALCTSSAPSKVMYLSLIEVRLDLEPVTEIASDLVNKLIRVRQRAGWIAVPVIEPSYRAASQTSDASVTAVVGNRAEDVFDRDRDHDHCRF
jgi:hypothetical protein